MVTRLQSEAEDGEKTTSENRCAHGEVGHSSTSGGSRGAGASSSSTGLRDTSRGLASTASSGGRLGGRTVRRLIEGPVAALGVASLSALELLGSVALAVGANGGVDAGIEPEVAHLGGDGLLVGAHHVGGDGGAVAASALVVEGRLESMSVDMRPIMAAGRLTASHSLPLLAIWPWPPQMSTQVFSWASHHDCLLSSGTRLVATEQQGRTVLLFWAAAKPARAETATMTDE